MTQNESSKLVCSVEEVLAEGLSVEKRQALVSEMSSFEGVIDKDTLMKVGEKYGVDSLTFIEARMAQEDCDSCIHGLGSAACGLGQAIAIIDFS